METKTNRKKEKFMNPNQELRKILKELQIKTPKRITKEFLNTLDWGRISRYRNLSEGFIENYDNLVDWYCISIYQKLSEPFIETYANQVHWISIAIYQKLSKPFSEKYADRIKTIEKFADRIGWKWLSR